MAEKPQTKDNTQKKKVVDSTPISKNKKRKEKGKEAASVPASAVAPVVQATATKGSGDIVPAAKASSSGPAVGTQPTKESRKVSFHEACDRYRVTVNAKRTDVIKRLEKLGCAVFVKQEERTCLSNHLVSAKVRLVATVKAFEYLESQMGETRTITSMYGSIRDMEVLDNLNGQVVEGQKVDMTIVHSALVPADFGRTKPNVRFEGQLDKPVDRMLLIDVYMNGASPLRPNAFQSFISVGGCAVWIGHCFRGAAGTIYDEGAWWRDEDSGIITHRPDRFSPISPQHDPCDWIWKSSAVRLSDGTTLSWFVKHSIGAGMVMVVFNRSAAEIPNVGMSGLGLDCQFSSVEVPVYQEESWWDRLKLSVMPLRYVLYAFPKRKVVVCDSVVSELRSLYAGRPRNVNLFRQIVISVNAKLATGFTQTLLANFGSKFQDIAFHTALCVFAGGIESEALGWMNVIADRSTILNAYNESLVVKSFNEPTTTVAMKRMAVAAVVLAGVLKLFQLRRSLAVGKVGIGSVAPGSMLHDVVLAPVYEEALKRLIPGLKYKFGWIEWVIKLLAISKVPVPPSGKAVLCLASSTTVGMHAYAASLPFVKGVMVHALWNLVCHVVQQQSVQGVLPLAAILAIGAAYYGHQWISRPNRYAEFRKAHYLNEWEDRPPLLDVINSCDFSPELSETPAQKDPFFTPKPLCPILSPKGTITLPSQTGSQNNFWWLLPTSVPGYVPLRNDENKIGVMVARILAAAPMLPLEQEVRWLGIAPLAKQHPPINRDDVVLPWLEHFEQPMQKKRYAAACQRYEEEGPGCCTEHLDKINVMVKVDELLTKTCTKPGSEDLFMQLKPRSIANVHPLVQVHVGPEIYEATQRFKKEWCVEPEPLDVEGWQVYLTYGGASTDEELTRWAEYSHIPKKRAMHIMVAGDDSIAIIWDEDGNMWIIEGDFGMFDQSQSFGPLRLEWANLLRYGVSYGTVGALERLSHASYVFRSGTKYSKEKIVVSREERPFRDTGGANTSLGNSLVTGHALVFVFIRFRGDLVKGFAHLGLDIKIKYPKTIGEATFLKGMWYRVDTPFGYHWGPLPSRLLKVGKSLRDPCELYKTKDLRVGAPKFLNEVAVGYSGFLLPPGLRVFVRNFLYDPSVEGIKPFYGTTPSLTTKPKLLEDEVLGQLVGRYGSSVEEIRDFEQRYPTRPFVFFEHPFFVRMNQVDYN